MHELGMFHYSMLVFDQSLKLHGEGFMGHCCEAIALFKQVKDKAPDVYKEDMLYRVRNQMPLKLEVPDSLEQLITESFDLYESYEDDDDEMDVGVGTISTYKQKMIDSIYSLSLSLCPSIRPPIFRFTYLSMSMRSGHGKLH